jgi:hypothetical protein
MDHWTEAQSTVVNERIDEWIAEADHERTARDSRPPTRTASTTTDTLRQRLGRRLIAVGTAIEGSLADTSPSEEPSTSAGGRA